jgi:hypothetical protein
MTAVSRAGGRIAASPYYVFMRLNRQVRELGRDPVWANPCVRHAVAIGLGAAEFDVQYTDVPDPVRPALGKLLAAGRT